MPRERSGLWITNHQYSVIGCGERAEPASEARPEDPPQPERRETSPTGETVSTLAGTLGHLPGEKPCVIRLAGHPPEHNPIRLVDAALSRWHSGVAADDYETRSSMTTAARRRTAARVWDRSSLFIAFGSWNGIGPPPSRAGSYGTTTSSRT